MSCLFNSIQFLLKEYDNNISNLRKIVFEYMEENLDELVGGETIKTWIELCNIDENNGMNVQEYINRIKKTDQWGGAPELAVISKIYNIQIQVVLHSKIISNFKSTSHPSHNITLKYTGGHYDPGNIIEIPTVQDV